MTAGSGGPVWGQSRMHTHTGSLCRGTEVTSWSPENAWLQGTNGQMSRLPALSGSSACLASLPSYSVAASELPSAPQGGKEKGGARLRGLLFMRVSSPSLPSSRTQDCSQPRALEKKPVYPGRAGWLPDPPRSQEGHPSHHTSLCGRPGSSVEN